MLFILFPRCDIITFACYSCPANLPRVALRWRSIFIDMNARAVAFRMRCIARIMSRRFAKTLSPRQEQLVYKNVERRQETSF